MNTLQQQLIPYAYNILGSYEDARDVVQDVLLRTLNIEEKDIQNKKAYLIKAVINTAVNVKKRQKKLLSGYPGEWLPEPVATEKADDGLYRKDILSYSLLVLMEKLNARQRAVFMLKEAFDYDHEEIASLLGISVENSRKLLSRAKKELRTDAVPANTGLPAGYLEKYMTIIQNGDVRELEQLLTEEIVLVSDGGGKATAAMHPLAGKERVTAFVLGISKKFYPHLKVEEHIINHQPALFYFTNGQLVTCQVFSITDGRISNMFFIRNPDKLKNLR